MIIEVKNSNKVFCYMMDDDLRALGISVDTLTYGSNVFRKLIDMVVKRTDEQYPGQFKHRDMPLLVEAVPLENKELFLQLQTVDEADELDPRFAQFSPGVFEEVFSDEEDSDDDSDELPAYTPTEPVYHAHPAARRISKNTPKEHRAVYTFSSYENLIASLSACQSFDELSGINSSLYYEPSSKRYFLTIKGRQNSHPYRVLMASFCEYSRMTPCDDTFLAWLSEHCRCLIRSKAIGELLKSI